MTEPTAPGNSHAFFIQSVIAFGVSLGSLIIAVAYLPVDSWIRAFLAIGILFLTSSAFTLAKVIRDNQESQAVHQRLDQARVEKLLAEHDPFRVVS